jgi:crotonobetainyl-CoA:carnitine CoA-transferase CaiB-like acyl-CoA transferase
VLELGLYVAAPFGTHALSQLGADVIKIESPRGGDPTRSVTKGGASGTFVSYSLGKRSVCIDLRTDAGQRIFQDLVETAHVVMTNLAYDSLQRLHVGPEDCHRMNPDVVYCQVSGYGPGPREREMASNPLIEAATGVMFDHRIDGRPARLGPSYQDMFAGLYGVIGILAELRSTRKNRTVEVGLFEAGMHVAARDLVAAQLADSLAAHERGGEFQFPGYGAYVTADDRWVYLMMLADDHWSRFCAAMGLPEATDDSLARQDQRRQQAERVEGIVTRAIAARTLEELVPLFHSADFAFSEVVPPGKVLDDIQAQQPGKTSVVHYRERDLVVPRFPVLADSIGANLDDPPALGQHTHEVLLSLGYSEQQCTEFADSGVAVFGGSGKEPNITTES